MTEVICIHTLWKITLSVVLKAAKPSVDWSWYINIKKKKKKYRQELSKAQGVIFSENSRTIHVKVVDVEGAGQKSHLDKTTQFVRRQKYIKVSYNDSLSDKSI